jgi:hypothetical protein
MPFVFDKYRAYSEAVQSPSLDARFLQRVYSEIRGQKPVVLREDFCGTFTVCCEWVKIDSAKEAVGVDLNPAPLAYGKKHYLDGLEGHARKRIRLYKNDVLSQHTSRADIICALNFSYFVFHSRERLLRYFTLSKKRLRSNGLCIVDVFGGAECAGPSTEVRRLPGMKYEFEQEDFDPITYRSKFHIHFAPAGQRVRRRVFTYDWRMWTIPELRDVMKEAGFRDIIVYWEGTGRDGRGSGRFYRRERGESCSIWIAYVVGVK